MFITATAKGLLTKQQESAPAKAQTTLGVMVGTKSVQERFEKMLGKKAPAFLSSLLTMTNNNKALQRCNPQTVLSSAAIAASLDLPVNPSLGFAWIVPYGGNAQFQMSAKGYVQLAMRSKLMANINVQTVYEGELVKGNRFTEEYDFDETKRTSDKAIGYYAFFRTTFGFYKGIYWTRDAVVKHAQRFSKSFGSGPWQTDFDAMAEKTVLKHLLSRYAPLSTEIVAALEADGTTTVVNEQGESEVIDVDFNTPEVAEETTEQTVEAESNVPPADYEVPMD